MFSCSKHEKETLPNSDTEMENCDQNGSHLEKSIDSAVKNNQCSENTPMNADNNGEIYFTADNCSKESVEMMPHNQCHDSDDSQEKEPVKCMEVESLEGCGKEVTETQEKKEDITFDAIE